MINYRLCPFIIQWHKSVFHCVFQTFAIVFIESYSKLIITIELILELSTIHNLSGFLKYDVP